MCAQPAQLVPTGRLLHQRGAKQRRAVDAAGLRARGDVAQVGRLHTGGQGKAGAFDAGIDRPDDGFVTGAFGPLHQLQRVLALGLGIELKPQRPAPLQGAAGVLRLVRNRLQRVTAQGAGHHARLQGGGGAHAGQFALRVGQGLVGHGGQQDGVF